MAAASRSQVIKLYRQMLKTGGQFSSYNFREYAKRRVRDAFHDHKGETDSEKIQCFVSKARENLEIMRRQVAIGKMYKHEKLVIETKSR